MSLPDTDRYGRTITALAHNRYRVVGHGQDFSLRFPDGTPEERILSAIEAHVTPAEAIARFDAEAQDKPFDIDQIPVVSLAAATSAAGQARSEKYPGVLVWVTGVTGAGARPALCVTSAQGVRRCEVVNGLLCVGAVLS